ncbi:hypothetical protein MRS44_006235 [Fusarium solani]|uniref:uncharacterized protein n=1 Tax=Fusarium solani TaxID=169388 RepID=UPI0032C40518|nr:hypothetical protein MRS44_006235 [Fusarium solani]
MLMLLSAGGASVGLAQLINLRLATPSALGLPSSMTPDGWFAFSTLNTGHSPFPWSAFGVDPSTHPPMFIVSCRLVRPTTHESSTGKASMLGGTKKVELTGRLRASMLPLTAGGRPQGCGLGAIASTFAAICYHLLATRPLPGRPDCQKNQARDASPGPPEPRAKPHLSLPVPRVRATASWRRPSPWKGSRRRPLQFPVPASTLASGGVAAAVAAHWRSGLAAG